MKAIILKCRSGSRFHLGEYADNQNAVLYNTSEYIHSDVLFGAFIAAMAKIYPEKLHDFRQLCGEGKIRFSSAFYCVKQKNTDKYIYLFPKPLSLNLVELNEHIDHKALKKIKFISCGIYREGIPPEKWFSDECVMPNNQCVFSKEEFKEDHPMFSLFEKVDLQKVKIHTDVINIENEKEKGEGSLYSQTDIMLTGSEEVEVNWYFLLDLNDQLSKDDENIFCQTLDLMISNGIGGDRSSGCGKIEGFEIEDFEFKVNNPSGKQMLLSLAFPKEEEKDTYLLYKTKIRSGMWYGSGKNERFKKLMAVEEGAILAGNISPQIYDLTENNNPQWKYGGNILCPLPVQYVNY
jgi:CRISPR-associated protein Csm4